jgi:hypothetical protein
MKKNLLFVFVLMLTGSAIFAQLPNSFSYPDVTGKHDQVIQGPCLAHATIAGMEAWYKRFYNESINLSELALYSCSKQSQILSVVLSYVENNGAISEDTDTEYPAPSDPLAEGKIRATIDCEFEQKERKSRYKIVCEKVPDGLSYVGIKEILYNKGPIIFNNCATSGFHVMSLIGWTADGKWIVKDSNPGIPDIAAEFAMNNLYVKIADAYFIKNIIKEIYNETTKTWSVELKIVKKTIPNPLCYNQGIYELIGYDNFANATVNWTYTASSQYEKLLTLTKNANNKECTVSGNAANVTLWATITRNTVILDKVSLNIGNVGVPSKLITLNGHCASGNYEITSKIEHPTIAGCTYNYAYYIPLASDGSYYVITSGQYAYWVFKTPNGLQYSAKITANQNNCSSISNTHSAIIYSSWCGTSYKSVIGSDLSDSAQVLEDIATLNKENPEENSPLVSPNPVRTDLTLKHIGEGINDIRMYDLSGTLVYSVRTNETVTVDVALMPRGVYIVRYFVDDAANPVKPIKIVLE